MPKPPDPFARRSTAGSAGSVGPDDLELLRLLELAREHLGMDTAFVSELTSTRQVFRAMTGAADSFGLMAGEGVLREQTYCDPMLSGRLPSLIPDTGSEPRVRDLEGTRAARIGAYVGVPLTLADGRLYGTLCCLSHEPDPLLDERDVAFLKLIARLITGRVTEMEAAGADRAEVQRVLDSQEIEMALQPIVCLATGAYRGAEALARFPGSSRAVDEMFALASSAGLGPELELLALQRGLSLLDDLPSDVYLSVNMSPQGIVDPRFDGVVSGCGALDRLVLEITEHAAVEQYASLHEILRPLRAAGMRLAVDDVGSGYASFRHVLQLRPDVIKIDRSLVDGVARDPAQRTVAGNIVLLALDLQATVVAEGVETTEDLDVLAALGADMAQGYLYARPSTDRSDWRAWARHPPAPGPPAPLRAVPDAPEPADPLAPAFDFSRCNVARTLQQACDIVCDDLVTYGFSMPSIYVLLGETLRCASARGYFQVVDGFELGESVIGRVAVSGDAELVADVTADPAFVAAVPGIRSEAAVAVWAEDRIFAVINVESREALAASTLTVLANAADCLGAWAAAHGAAPMPGPQDDLVRTCRVLANTSDADAIRRLALEGAIGISGMSSAALLQSTGEGGSWEVTAARGSLAGAARGWPPDALSAMAGWVSRGTSSHVPVGEQPLPEHEFLAGTEINALAVHPLVCDGKRAGLLVLLDRRRHPRVQTAQRAMLEQLALSAALALRGATDSRTGEVESLAAATDERGAPTRRWWLGLSPAQREFARDACTGELSPGLLASLGRAGICVPGEQSEAGELRYAMPTDVRQFIETTALRSRSTRERRDAG